jgi:hypothetical protein
MKKMTIHFLINILAICCALMLVSKISVADQAFAPPEVKALGRIEVKYHDDPPDGATVNFTKNNVIIKTIELKGKICGRSPDPNCSYSIIPNYFETHIAITELHFKKNSPEEYFNRGLEYEKAHNICFYDTQGNLLFEKKSTIYNPVKVSNDGSLVICYQEAPEEITMDVSNDLKELPYKTEIFILNRDGREIFKKEIIAYFGNISISKNATWVLLNVQIKTMQASKTVYIRFNTQTNTSLEIDSQEMYEYGRVFINNNGQIILEKTIGKGAVRQYEFNPTTKKKNELGIVKY